MGKRILSFEVEQARRGAYARGDRGLQTVEVARIVGSVGRAAELDWRFRHRSRLGLGTPRSSAMRMRRLHRLFETGRVPPLELYQIEGDLFVLDGHHRVAVALQRGQEYLEAHLVEYLPDRADPANVVYYERAAFVAATGLRDVHATEAGRYPRLLNRVRDHRHEVARQVVARRWAPTSDALALGIPRAAPGRPTLRAAARDWYEREYLPVVEVLVAEGIPARFPGRQLGDLYGYVCDHQWYLGERRRDVDLDVALVDFVHQHRPETIAETLLDPIAALGTELLGDAPGPHLGFLRNWSAYASASFAAGLLALPIAFLRGLRLTDYRFHRVSL